MRFVLIGAPESRRVALFQAALGRQGLRPAVVISYPDLLAGRTGLEDVVTPGGVVRIESPDRDFEAERALLALGAGAPDEDGFERLTRREVEDLTFDRGRILPSRQWYRGFCRALRLIQQQLAGCPEHRLMNRPADIEVMFDKPRCHERLAHSGVAVPRSPGVVRSFEALVAWMRQARCEGVFVKPAHGSSASGVVAYRTDGQRHQAITTVETVRQGGELWLYNTRQVRTLRDPAEIAMLIDALCCHRVHVEQWLPKAGLEGRVIDLRVVVIGGQAKHAVVRKSRSPMTNLHLLNERGEIGALQDRMGRGAWEAALRTCEQAMGCFGGSLYSGIDLLITPDYRRHAVLEVNAFGDLLPNVLWNGLDTYEAEVAAVGAFRCSGVRVLG